MAERITTDRQTHNAWPNRLAGTTCALTFALLFAGGSVTSYDVGMAVPDWPTSFGQSMITYNFREASFGVQVEHVHRLLGVAVGLATLAFAVSVVLGERRTWLCWLAGAALAAVILQGVLGGLRVRLNAALGRELAVIHGAAAHLYFGLLAALYTVTSQRWKDAAIAVHDQANRMRAVALALAIGVYLQILLGAVMRHFGNVGGVFVVHILVAAALTLLVLWFAIAVLSDPPLRRALFRPIVATSILVVLQVFLGLGAALATRLAQPGFGSAPSDVEAAIMTIHLVVGSLLFAVAIVIALVSFSQVRSNHSAHVAIGVKAVLGVAQ